MNKFFLSVLSMLSIFTLDVFSQVLTTKYTLDEFISLAYKLSIDAVDARNTYITNCYKFIDTKADNLPSLSFNATLPNFNRSITWNESTQNVINSNSLTNNVRLNLEQKVPLTGGTLSMSSYLEQITLFESHSPSSYLASPVSMSYAQPLFGFNIMKWVKKISPIEFEIAQRKYISALQAITNSALDNFFEFKSAQEKLKASEINYNNLDTLFKISNERLAYGTMNQNDVMQMEISLLKAKSNLISDKINLATVNENLSNFFGLSDDNVINFDLILPDTPPIKIIEYQNAYDVALKNNPELLSEDIKILEAKRDLEQAKRERFKIDLNVTFGLDHASTTILPDMYKKPYDDRQQIQVSINAPIIDWGKQRRKIHLAVAKEEMANLQIKKALLNFERDFSLDVLKFNSLDEAYSIAKKTDTLSIQRYEINKRRFLIGKIETEKLNDAIKEKTDARIKYIDMLKSYWELYFSIQKKALYDFSTNQSLISKYENYLKP